MSTAQIKKALQRASIPDLKEALTGAMARRDRLAGELWPELSSGKQSLKQESAPMKTMELVTLFLESKRSCVSEASVTSYKGTLVAFTKRCPVLPITPQELESYFARFDKDKQTANSAYSPIKQLYEFANQRYGIPNAMATVKRPCYKPKEPYAFSLDEARMVLEACRDERELGLIHLYLGHGWRLEEGCRANIGDVGDGQILVRGKKRNEYMPLLSETRELLLRLAQGRAPGEPLFLSLQNKRLSHKQTYNVTKAILKRAGVIDGKALDLRIATHTLRKTFASLAYAAGCDGRIIERLLRHRKGDVTSLYIAMPMDMLKRDLYRYSPIRLLNHKEPKQELPKIEY